MLAIMLAANVLADGVQKEFDARVDRDT